MTNQQRTTFRNQLTRQLSEVTSHYKTHRMLLDVPGESGASEVSAPIAESEENLAAKITAALVRLDEGSYGNCTGCGQAIPIPRLKAKPCVSLCIGCQLKKEAQLPPSRRDSTHRIA